MLHLSRLIGAACSCAAVLTLTAPDVAAQPSWAKLTPTTNPTARFGHAMSYDIIRNRVVLFGGWDTTGRSLDDTWEFDGTTWTKLSPANSPPGRDGHTMVYDFPRARTLLFGGDAAGNIVADTWVWDGVNWTQLAPTTNPPARKSHTLTYDANRAMVVMFGGNAGGGVYLNDTWDWNGTDWRLRSTTTSPAARIAHCAAYDPINKGVLVFSGYQLGNDTWLFDGTNWRQLMPATSPPTRYDSTLTLDELRGRLVLYGHVLDLWEWDGTNWLQRSPATMPTNRRDQDVVYDVVQQRVIMFGGGTGFPDTWEYKTNAVPSYTSFGAACRGTAGLPELKATNLPWVGESLTLRVTNIPPSGGILMLTGFSNTKWGAINLPANLTPNGLTGCFLRAEPRFIFAVGYSNGVLNWDLPIPPDPLLIGFQFYNQAAVYDALANPGLATTTNGGAGVIGVK